MIIHLIEQLLQTMRTAADNNDKICKDDTSKTIDGGVCEVNDMLHDMSTNDNNVSICANCGKEGSDINNICNKCKQVKYCNAICKKKHKKKHKKECKEHVRLATEKHNEELRIAAELHEIELFKQPPPAEDCPICFLLLPSLTSGWRYMSCCGKIVCCGCCFAPVYDSQGNEVTEKVCPFCRAMAPTSYEETIKREKNRVEMNDAIAIYSFGNYYRDGVNGYEQDYSKALELWHRAGELGYGEAYCSIGYAHQHGEGVEVDEKKATVYYEIAAIGGDEDSRYNLGNNELRAGNTNRALKHYMIAIEGGSSESLKMIRRIYNSGYATKEDYTKALHSYQEYLGEIKSKQRDEAAAYNERFRYY